MNAARKNVALLATCQALLFANNSTVIAINGLAGYALTDNKALATLPVTAWVCGGALITLPVSLLMKRFGRRAGFHLGAGLGALGALICALAVSMGNFWLLCLGTLIFGSYNGVAQYYRFAAADASPPDFKSTAISLVLAGGLVGGLIGPEVSKFTVDALQAKYMGAYLSLLVYLALVMGVLSFLSIPRPSEAEQKGVGRPMREIAKQPKFIVAVLAGAGGYAVMNFLMVATPLAMGFCGHPYAAAALVIQWHIIGMFAPSFFTGGLIKRFGVLNMLLVGIAILYVCVGIALSGLTVAHFWFALMLLGVGWNFLYIGGTTLLTETYRPEERAKVQGINDMTIFATLVLTSLFSGALLDGTGWHNLNYFALPIISAMAVGVVWLIMHRRSRPAAA